MDKTKRLSVYIYLPPDWSDKYGEEILVQNTARSLMIVGFALVQTRDLREYLQFGKEDRAQALRVFFTPQDPVMYAAFQEYQNNHKPLMYWTSLFMLGVHAIYDRQLPQWVSPPLPYPVAPHIVQMVDSLGHGPSFSPSPAPSVHPQVMPPQPAPLVPEPVREPVSAAKGNNGLKGLMAGGKTRKISRG